MNVRQQLIREEGVVPHVYRDSLGYWSIGVGRLVDERKGGRLRQSEIDFMLDNDIAELRERLVAVLPWFSQLNEPRQAALIGMAFQLGVGGLLGFPKTLAALRDGHYAHAYAMALDSEWARQTPERARRMARQLETGEWQ